LPSLACCSSLSSLAIWKNCIQQQFQMKSFFQVSGLFLELLWSTTASAVLMSNKFVDSSNATGTESGYSVHICQNLCLLLAVRLHDEARY
jgi:hypothetical protein